MHRYALRLSTLAVAALVTAAHASVTFTNISFSGSATAGGTLTDGASVVTLGNSLTFNTPNAIVGIGATSGITDGSVLLQYDAWITGGPAVSVAWEVDTLIQGFLAGSGSLFFREDVIELDGAGNEVNPSTPIGTVIKTWTASSPETVWGSKIILSKQVQQLRVKKFFYLDASTDTPGLDRSVLGRVNQSIGVVPEPASMAALGLGVAALARRRRKS